MRLHLTRLPAKMGSTRFEMDCIDIVPGCLGSIGVSAALSGRWAGAFEQLLYIFWEDKRGMGGKRICSVWVVVVKHFALSRFIGHFEEDKSFLLWRPSVVSI